LNIKKKGHKMQKKVETETIVRTVLLFVALFNQILTISGKNPLPFAEEDIYSFVSLLCTVVATVWSWWKNNSFTQAALEADELLGELKKESEDNKV